MCEFEINTRRYRDCDLAKSGRNVQAHTIGARYVHLCEDPKPAPGSESTCCDERLQTPRVTVQNSADRGHTLVTGVCPACKAAEEKCHEEFIIRNSNAPTSISDVAQPVVTQPVVDRNSSQSGPVVEQDRAAEQATKVTTETKKRPHARQSTSTKGQQSTHGKSDDCGCIIQ